MDKYEKKKLRKKYEEQEFEKALASSIETKCANELIKFSHSTNKDVLKLIDMLKQKYPKNIYLPFTRALSMLLTYTSEVENLSENSIAVQNQSE